MNIKVIIFSFLIFTTIIMNSYASNNYYIFSYEVKRGENLEVIISKFLKLKASVSSDSEMMNKIIEENPHVFDWKKLYEGTKIKLFIEKKVASKSKIINYLKPFRKKKEKKFLNLDGFSLFYMASSGTFQQEGSDTNSENIEFEQNSPFSFGLAGLKKLKNKKSISFSTYISFLVTKNSRLAVDIDPPPEIGVTTYYQTKYKDFDYYYGLDIESFSTYSLGDLAQRQEFIVNKNNVLYFTLGTQENFKVFNSNLFTKLSFSYSLFVLTEFGEGVQESFKEESYSGYKLMSYFKYDLLNNWYMHFLFKYHQMSGPDSLSSFRSGLGVGYSF